MSTARIQLLKDRADAAAVKAREVAERAEAEGRAMTPAEEKIYTDSTAVMKDSLAGIKACKADQQMLTNLRAEFGSLGSPLADSKTGRRLSFKGMAAGVARQMLGTPDLGGVKALAPSGATVVPQAFTPDPVALGRAATGLLDVLPVREQGTSEYAFIRQTTRTNNAATVAEGALKPTSVLGLTRVEQTLAVVAHLSEGIPRYWLADNESLEAFVNAELEFGLRAAVEAKVVSDVNGTSGIQTQDYSTSIIETIRKSLTKLEVVGLTPAAIALHPSDFEAVELGIASADAVTYNGLPYDPAARRLFGVPIATTISATAGTGHVLAADAVAVDVDAQGVQVMWSETSNADDWAKNLIRARCEGRFGTSVLSPLGVVVATLAAGE